MLADSDEEIAISSKAKSRQVDIQVTLIKYRPTYMTFVYSV